MPPKLTSPPGAFNPPSFPATSRLRSGSAEAEGTSEGDLSISSSDSSDKSSSSGNTEKPVETAQASQNILINVNELIQILQKVYETCVPVTAKLQSETNILLNNIRNSMKYQNETLKLILDALVKKDTPTHSQESVAPKALLVEEEEDDMSADGSIHKIEYNPEAVQKAFDKGVKEMEQRFDAFEEKTNAINKTPMTNVSLGWDEQYPKNRDKPPHQRTSGQQTTSLEFSKSRFSENSQESLNSNVLSHTSLSTTYPGPIPFSKPKKFDGTNREYLELFISLLEVWFETDIFLFGPDNNNAEPSKIAVTISLLEDSPLLWGLEFRKSFIKSNTSLTWKEFASEFTKVWSDPVKEEKAMIALHDLYHDGVPGSISKFNTDFNCLASTAKAGEQHAYETYQRNLHPKMTKLLSMEKKNLRTLKLLQEAALEKDILWLRLKINHKSKSNSTLCYA